MKNIKLIFTIMLLVVTAILFGCNKEEPTPEPPEEDFCFHEFNEYTVIKAPTTEATGKVSGICYICGEKVEISLLKLGDIGYSIFEEEMDCEKGGKFRYESEYGIFYADAKAPGHNYYLIGGVGTSCEADGYEEYKCSRCGKIYKNDIKAKGHEYEIKEEFEGTCAMPAYVIKACKNCDKEILEYGEEKHEYGEEGVHTAGTCTEYGYTEYTCAICGETKKVNDEFYTHTYDESGNCILCENSCDHEFDKFVCKLCGLDIKERMETNGYFHYDMDSNGKIDDGESIFMGYYPNRHVRDYNLIDILKKITPDEDGYYPYDGNRYARRKLDQPYDAIIKFEDGSVVANIKIDKEDYFYLLEPIEWVVLQYDIVYDRYLLQTKNIIDVCKVNDSVYQADDNYYYKIENKVETKFYANNWQTSDIREMLNGSFYNASFTEKQKEFIDHTNVDNLTTGYYLDLDYMIGDFTEDYVFLPAFSELFDEDEAMDNPSEDRVKIVTDYTIGGGINLTQTYETKKSLYFMRSAGRNSYQVCGIDIDGKLVTNMGVNKVYGLAPCINFKRVAP